MKSLLTKEWLNAPNRPWSWSTHPSAMHSRIRLGSLTQLLIPSSLALDARANAGNEPHLQRTGVVKNTRAHKISGRGGGTEK